MSELAIEVQNQELANFDFDCEYQQQLEQEQEQVEINTACKSLMNYLR